MKEILLNSRKGVFAAVVDDADYAWLSQYRWNVLFGRNTNYAVRYEQIAGKRQVVYMHRMLVVGADLVDHEDRDGLNNQRHNLRPATYSTNGANSRQRQGAYSKYRGVRFEKRTGKWYAVMRFQRSRIHVGTFFDEIEAAKAYDTKARQLFGEFAKTNF